MKVEIVAIGTELLLGQVDTNSAWIGERLAAVGVDCHFQTRVGDNVERIAEVLKSALGRSDAVICCGGLGPTQDDVTREAIARAFNLSLRRDDQLEAQIKDRFATRVRLTGGSPMPQNNLRQADVPHGATIIPQRTGTAPGLIHRCDSGTVYALPGVPVEMKEMMDRAVVPDLQARQSQSAVIASRVLLTWGLGESSVAELVAPRVSSLDRKPDDALIGTKVGATIAFLASASEGVKVRVTAKAADLIDAQRILATEERLLRSLLGDYVFGTDEESLQYALSVELKRLKMTIALAESLTGGLLASKLVSVPGASEWFLGAVVAYAPSVKRRLLSVSEGQVITAQAAEEMAIGARSATGADVGLALTGVAGPAPQEGHQPGTVYCGVSVKGQAPQSMRLDLGGDRETLRQLSANWALDWLRKLLRTY